MPIAISIDDTVKKSPTIASVHLLRDFGSVLLSVAFVLGNL